MPTIVLCRPLHASGMALLEARHDVTIRTLNRPSPKQLAEAMPGAHAVLVGLEEVDEALLAGAPDLRVVSRFGVGYDEFRSVKGQMLASHIGEHIAITSQLSKLEGDKFIEAGRMLIRLKRLELAHFQILENATERMRFLNGSVSAAIVSRRS